MMQNPLIQLLLVEDNSADAALLQELLEEASAVPVEMTVVTRLKEALNQLQARSFDIILLDLSLPDTYGLSTLVQVQQQAGNVPVVVMTGLDNEELAVEAVSLGAQDYLVKGKVDSHLLIRAIRYAIERKRSAEALRLQAEREHLLGLISQRIRQSLDLAAILHTTVTEVRQFLQSDRVLVYRFNVDWSGIVVAESVADGCKAIYGSTITDTCFRNDYAQLYQQGRSRAIEDIYNAGLNPCHLNLLKQCQVRASLIVPILYFPGEQGKGATEQESDRAIFSFCPLSPQPPNPPTSFPKLWGLLIVHQCSGKRSWQLWETDLLDSLSTQVGIAIQQSELYQQVQQLNSDLERQVQERTAQLQRALFAEEVLKRIADKVRDSLDESQILPTAVRELALAMQAESVQAALYDPKLGTATIRYEYARSESTWTGRVLSLSERWEIYHQLLSGECVQFCELVPTRSSSPAVILACPLVDEQGVVGDLWLFKSFQSLQKIATDTPAPLEDFPLKMPLETDSSNELELRLVQQVATACAIALRQARLYQAARSQVRELERLNLLKDDFLSTVSHELRTPVANIKMAVQMLEVTLRTQEDKDPISPLVAAAFGDLPSKVEHYIQILHDECDREINLINDLLDLQRLNAGVHPLDLTPIQLQDWIPHILEPFSERIQRNQQILLIDISPTLPPSLCDRTSLSRILTELLNNACKYTPPGEQISVTVWTEADKLNLQIANSGTEIPDSELERIFEKFYRIPSTDPWKQGGTGLGLALVQKLANYLGGTIRVASSEGKTSFTVELPLTPFQLIAPAQL